MDGTHLPTWLVSPPAESSGLVTKSVSSPFAMLGSFYSFYQVEFVSGNCYFLSLPFLQPNGE